MEDLFKLKGRLVVAQNEGIQLGVATGLTIDKAEGRISAFVFREKWRARDRWVKTSDVISVGRDLIVVASETKVQKSKIPRARLADYRGCWVTTLSGVYFGRLENMATQGADWTIRRLEFQNGSTLEIDGKEIIFGQDKIMAPNKFASRIVPAKSVGTMIRARNLIRNVLNESSKRIHDLVKYKEKPVEEPKSEVKISSASPPTEPIFDPEPIPKPREDKEANPQLRQ